MKKEYVFSREQKKRISEAMKLHWKKKRENSLLLENKDKIEKNDPEVETGSKRE